MLNSTNNTDSNSTLVIPYLETGTIIGIAIASYFVACWIYILIYDYFYGHIRDLLQHRNEQRVDRRSVTSATTNSNLRDPSENGVINNRIMALMFRSQTRTASTNSELGLTAVPTPTPARPGSSTLV